MIIHIEAATAEELREKVLSLAQMFGGGSQVTHSGPAIGLEPVEINEPLEAEEEEPAKPAKKTRGRKKAAPEKEAAPEEASDETPETETEPEAETEEVKAPVAAAKPSSKAVTKEEALAALQQVSEEFGIPKAREVLAHFKCARISELKEADYPAFVEHCNKVLVA